MKRRVLLDENVPHQLRAFLPEHDIQTASYAGFAGLKNGALLNAATEAKFEVLITADKTIQDEQNLRVARTWIARSVPLGNWGSLNSEISVCRTTQV